MPATWIFQGNPDEFDVDAYLQQSAFVYWLVKLGAHQQQVSIGDRVFFWRARGSSKMQPGIVASGLVRELPVSANMVERPEALSGNLWKSEIPSTGMMAGIELDDVRLSPEAGMLLLRVVRHDPILSRMTIVTRRTGTNFKVKPDEAAQLDRLWTDRFTHSNGESEVTVADLSDRSAVLRTIEIFDEMGREAFLERYGFGPAKWWYLLHNTGQYDSKAIAGVALAIQNNIDGRLNTFKGGEASVVRKLRSLGFEVLRTEITDTTTRLAEEVSATFPEGLRRTVVVNVAERSASARIACLATHGTSCAACGMNFESSYGSQFAGYMHVHHLHPISGAKQESQVNPQTDLVPICPNCHAVVHHGGEVRSVEEVQELFRQARLKQRELVSIT